jgi:hypothetical protein
MHKFLKSTSFVFALGLTACQQMVSEPGKLATEAAATYAANISRAFPRGNAAAGRALDNRLNNLVSAYDLPQVSPRENWASWNGGWNQVSQSGMYGNYLMYPNMADELTRCDQMVDAIPERVENLDFLLATLERCLFRLTVHKSPVMNATWAAGGSEILNYAGYLTDYARPAKLGEKSQGPYYSFLSTGLASYLTPTN